MFATTKILHTSHLIAAKVLTGKSIVTASVLAGTITTGYVIPPETLSKYAGATAIVLNAAALQESPTYADLMAEENNRQRQNDLAAKVDPSVPHLTVSVRKMTRFEKKAHDSDYNNGLHVAKK